MFTARRTTAVVAILLVAFSLAGCTPPDPEPTDVPGATATVEPAPTAAPTASAAPTAEPAPVAEPLTCESIVPQSRLDWIAAQGLTLFAPDEFFAKLNSEGFDYPELYFQRAGGIVCPYSSSDSVKYVCGHWYWISPESRAYVASDREVLFEVIEATREL